MKKIFIVFMMLFITSAYAGSTMGNVSVTISPPPAQLSQESDGEITISGPPPLYCASDEQGNITCYF